MDQSLFNWHDLVLMLTAFECLIACLFVFSIHPRPWSSSTWLSGLLWACFGAIALNEVILWGATFRYWVLAASPNIFFSLAVSHFCAGPLLWLAARRLRPQGSIPNHWPLHFIPALLFLFYLWFTFWNTDSGTKTQLLENYQFASLWHYPWVEFAGRLLRLIYTLLALRLLLPLLQTAHKPFALLPTAGRLCLWVLAAIISLDLALALVKVFGLTVTIPAAIYKVMGLTINYATFLLINLFLYAWGSPILRKSVEPKPSPETPPVSRAQLDRIEEGISQQKLYLNANLSVERFATAIGLQPKELSNAINRHYGISFIEFINQHRIQEARRLLELPSHQRKSITDIFYEAGFNSKSVYNTLFKKTFDCTPSQYRKTIKLSQAQSK